MNSTTLRAAVINMRNKAGAIDTAINVWMKEHEGREIYSVQLSHDSKGVDQALILYRG
ncbi:MULTISPECIES: hypothetical protein [Paenibacillus]|uniref:hypothetical protein n=1 Tax=Paenibacillus TaxID=44249 RepID=UPI0015C32956|nr:hypothetical protein [Paenibacillus odorifer]